MFDFGTLTMLLVLASVAVADTMLAAVYEPGHNKLVLNPAYPVPTPGEGEVLLKVAACGVCHSDVFFLSAARPDPRTYVLGHEIVGTPAQLGAGVQNISTTQLYGVLIIDPSNPNSGTSTIGTGLDGGYAEFVLVNQSQLFPVPDGLAPEVATAGTDSLLTVFNAVNNVAQVTTGERVLIYGVGGLGHQAVQLAKHLGATVFAVDLRPEARQLALDLGATQVFDLEDFAAVTSNGTFHVDTVVDFVATAQSFELSKAAVALSLSEGFAGLSTPGKIVLVGISADNLNFASVDLIESNIRVYTSLYGSRNDMQSAFDLLSQGVIKPNITVAPLEDINTALEALTAHDVTGRMVVIPGLNSTATTRR
ncbi:GroES-like protein [Trametes versicolor FP-101664 SS1]|uniref:GroES-like protein n=1 Tax=Trametes versicolor (strain FP-101664) TaxID=717944 RepID=UPI00046218CE|nr:GroES-like protein [Trametes versicolor FP-101664 SS1]EIW62659.1 GroES-like protein [Trametes versicolor FP-101664 SS1]